MINGNNYFPTQQQSSQWNKQHHPLLASHGWNGGGLVPWTSERGIVLQSSGTAFMLWISDGRGLQCSFFRTGKLVVRQLCFPYQEDSDFFLMLGAPFTCSAVYAHIYHITCVHVQTNMTSPHLFATHINLPYFSELVPSRHHLRLCTPYLSLHIRMRTTMHGLLNTAVTFVAIGDQLWNELHSHFWICNRRSL